MRALAWPWRADSGGSARTGTGSHFQAHWFFAGGTAVRERPLAICTDHGRSLGTARVAACARGAASVGAGIATARAATTDGCGGRSERLILFLLHRLRTVACERARS